MNTLEILVLIFIGFLILNHSINYVEGLENNDATVTSLLKEANTLTLQNQNQIKTVNNALMSTSKKFEGLQESLKTVSKNTATNKMINHGGHTSVPPLPTGTQVNTPTPPKGQCPSKRLPISWPAVGKEGMISNQLNAEINTVWKPDFSKIRSGQNAVERLVVGSIDVIVVIETIGNEIQKTLQNKKF